jgi:hypothetical protein
MGWLSLARTITQDGLAEVSLMSSTITQSGREWTITRLPSALDTSRASNRVRPWLSRDQEVAKQQERIARVRRENGIPSPEEWMW